MNNVHAKLYVYMQSRDIREEVEEHVNAPYLSLSEHVVSYLGLQLGKSLGEAEKLLLHVLEKGGELLLLLLDLPPALQQVLGV